MKISLKFCAIVIITTAVAFNTVNATKYLENKPDYLIPCHLTDSNFKKCFAQNFQVIFREWKDGLPGFKAFGPLDPLPVKRVVIHQDPQNPVSLSADLTDVMLTGVSKLVVKAADFSPKKLVTTLELFFPTLVFESDYKVNGRILNLALNGKGKSIMKVENLSIHIDIKLKLRDEHGFTFTDIKKLDMAIKNIGGLHVNFDNLFNGQKALEESANNFFNENWRDFYQILLPAISEAVRVIMNDRLSAAFSYVPANYFFEDIPTAADNP